MVMFKMLSLVLFIAGQGQSSTAAQVRTHADPPNFSPPPSLPSDLSIFTLSVGLGVLAPTCSHLLPVLLDCQGCKETALQLGLQIGLLALLIGWIHIRL